MGWVNKDSSIVRKYSNGGKTPEKEGSEKTSKLSDMAKKGAMGVAAIGAPATIATAATVAPIIKYWKEHGKDAARKKYGKSSLWKAAMKLKVAETKPTKKYKEGEKLHTKGPKTQAKGKKTESDKSALEIAKEYGMEVLKSGPSLPAIATRAFMKFYRDNPEKFKKSELSKGPKPPLMKKPRSK